MWSHGLSVLVLSYDIHFSVRDFVSFHVILSVANYIFHNIMNMPTEPYNQPKGLQE